MSLSFFVAGIPKGQPRVKACRRGSFAGVYDPGTADGWKSCIRTDFKNLTFASKKPIFSGPVVLKLLFLLPRPKSHYRRSGELKPNAPTWHTGKPDADNLAKAVLDALTNAGAWADDSTVCILHAEKRYCTATGCEIKIGTADVLLEVANA